MRLPIVFILLTIVIDAMGIGLIMPVMPDLIQEVMGGSLAQAAIWGGILSAGFAVMQFLFSPMLGGLSDRFGRRPVLLVSLAIMAADYAVMAVAGSIWLLLAGRLVGGVTAATHAAASAAMADLSEDDKKAQGFGLISAAFGIGFVLGPLLGGVLGEWGTRAPFWAAAVLAAANAGLGYVVLKETVTDEIRRPLDWRRMNPFGAFAAVSELPGIARGLSAYFLYQVSYAVYPAVWAYFGHARFNWDVGTIGISLGLFGVSMAVVQAGLIRVLISRLGEQGTALFGLGFSAIAYGLIAIVTNGTLALILTPVAALGAAFAPALQGMLSRQIGPARQGEIQGVLSSAAAMATIISPLLMTQVFAGFTAPDAAIYFPGAPFLLSLVLVTLAYVVMPGRKQ